ncbi:MAG: glycosyltransferase 87 family protein [Acidobacteriota bacterium]
MKQLLPLSVIVLLVLAHVETGIGDALRPLSRPEMQTLPAPLSILRGVPSDDRPYFKKPGPEPAILILRGIGVALLVSLVVCVLLAGDGRSGRAASSVITGLLVLTLYAIPASVPIVARARTHDPALAHDGGTIQIEVASGMLLAGKNPYRETYRGTPLESWRGLETPIVEHFPYFPWALLPLVPAVALGVADLRIVYALFLLGTAILLAIPARRHETRLALFCLPFFAPLLAKATMLGTNDAYAIFWIVAALFAIERGWHRSGLALLGLAFAVKQFSWLLAPLLLAVLWKERDRRVLLLAPAAFLAVTLPFALWDPASFLDDTFGYGLGGSATMHPVKGVGAYGFGNIALAFGLVRTPNDPFPYTSIGIAICAAILALGARRLHRTPSIAAIPALFAAALLPLLYFARYLHANFLGYAVFFLLWGALRQDPDAP